MNLKSKLRSFLGATALVLPVAFFASCQTRFDQVNDHKLVIAHTFNSREGRFLALDQIVKLWNETEKVKNKEEGFYPITLNRQFAQTYAEQGNALELKLKAKNANQLVNLIFGYPTLAAVASQYDMSLKYSDFPSLQNAIKTTFPPEFLQESKEIAGLNPKEYWIIPSLKSSRTLLVNGPVLNYVVQQATTQGTKKATIKQEDKIWFENLDKEKTDTEYIKKVWGDYVPIPLEQGGLEGYEFSKSSLENYQDFFDLISRIRKSFPNNFEESKNKNKDKKFIIGVDDIGNSLYSIAFANADADFSKFLFSLEKNPNAKNDSDTVIKYATFLDDKTSPRYQTALKTFNQIDKLLKEDAIYFYGLVQGNPPSNTYLNDHHMLFAITTTSNYRNRFATPLDRIDILEFLKDPVTQKELLKTRIKNSLDVSSTPVYAAFSPTKEEAEHGILFKFTSINNKSSVPTGSWWTYNSNNTQTNYMLKFKSYAVKQSNNKLSVETWDANPTSAQVRELDSNTEFLNLINSLNKPNASENEAKNTQWKAYFFNKPESFKKEIPTEFKAFNNLNLLDSSATTLEWINIDKTVVYKKLDADKSLNEDEIHFLIEPNKKDRNSTKKLVTFQGPGLIGIHANKEEDLATANFLKWFISEKQSFKYKEKEGEPEKTFQGTANEYLGFRGNYLAPTNDNLSSNPDDSSKFPQNRLFKLLFNTFQNVKLHPEENVVFSEPAGSLSGELRTNITKAFISYSNQIKSSPNTPHNYETFVKNLKDLFSPKKIK
ncbi:P68 family surface lipoprotein [Mesomycoplasma hyorhinis]|uniref:P68 family surface lipoprotein n=1 Tax=Mesomycoplasma hyorhinis TaxID=2100 RepID=UPI001C03F1F8|nr:P80 family lipoprotein [Mesomycoplasma hyorhinis]